MGKRLPITTGTVTVPGISESVAIRRDRFGVPHIDASNDPDAWYAVGFCHGQDRAFQLETRLRVIRGTLAELIGAEGLPIDRLARQIGFRRHGEAALEALEPRHRALAEAYARGVTEGSAFGLDRRPHPFVLLRSRPTPYEAADAMGFLAFQSFALASNWDVELARLAILRADGPDAVAALDPTYPEWQPTSAGVVAGPRLSGLGADLAALAQFLGLGGGSNNWALAGTKTATGRPMLANDPHLAPLLPPHWYLIHVTTPDWSVAGASFPGGPAIPVGHNGHAAWGITAGLTDNTDLFIEEIGPDGRSVRRADRFEPCRALHEVISVRGGDPVDLDVLIADRGPIVGEVFADAPAVSMAATWLQPRPLGALFDLVRIASFADLRATFESFPALPLNVAYADAGGSIGWQLIGDVPIRKRGTGAVPLPAADPETGWEDAPLPFDRLPHVVDPPIGFVATANNLPSPDAEGLGVDFLDGYRVARIRELLEERDDWTVNTALAMQMDRFSIPWRELRPIVLAAVAGAPGAALLESWDGRLDPDSAAATLFEFLLAELITAVAGAKAPRSAGWALGEGAVPLIPFSGFVVRRTSHLVRLMREQPEGWFPDGWPARIRTALADSLAAIEEAHGSDPDGWAWGTVRTLTLTHPLGLRRPLGRVFNLGPIPHGGDANTINPAPVDPRDPGANPDFAVASLRAVIDVGQWEMARFVLPGGQSGNPFSRHYADQLPLWAKGDGLPIAWSPDAVARSTRATLRLRPLLGPAPPTDG